MSEAVSQGETEGSEGRNVGGRYSKPEAAASGEHKVQRTPEKKTGFDVLKSSPKNGEQVRMPGGRETRTGKNKNKKKPQLKSYKLTWVCKCVCKVR